MAISGGLRKRWSLSEVRDRVGDYSLWRYYIGDFKPGKCIKSPFRVDSTPSFFIYFNDEGILKFMDLGKGKDKGDIGDIVGRRYGVSLYKAILKMVDDFGLDGTTLKIDTTEFKKEEEGIIKEKIYASIQVITKNYTLACKRYWDEFYITGDELKREEIYSLKEIWVDKRRVRIPKDELVFGYYVPELDRWKIYRPHADKKHKWITNIPSTYMEGQKGIIKARNLLITKARKDRIIWRKFLPHVTSIQSEGMHCFDEHNIKWVEEHSLSQWYNADIDEAGVENSEMVTKSLGYKPLNIPSSLLGRGIKDLGDWAKADGLKPIENYLKERNLIV